MQFKDFDALVAYLLNNSLYIRDIAAEEAQALLDTGEVTLKEGVGQ